MLSGLQSFLSRHKRKFIVTGVVVGGAVFAARYAQRRLEEFTTKEAMGFIESTRRLQHFDAMDNACNTTIMSLVPSVFETILKIADCEQHVLAIQSTKTGKLKIWEVLKVEVLSRVLLQMCAGSMIVILLKIQLNIVGASMLKDKQYSSEVQKKYLSMCNSFISDKMRDLYALIRRSVDAVFNKHPLTQLMTVSQTENLLWFVYNRMRIEEGNPIDNMCQYMIPPDSWVTSADGLSAEEHQQLQSLITDTKDLLNSGEVKKLTNLLASQGCGFFTDNFLPFFPCENEGNAPSDEELWNLGNTGSIPLARLISNMQGATRQIDLFTSWVNLLLINETFKMFGANVYEAFCSPV